MQWCFDDLLLWNIWNMSNDQRNPYQEWRDLVIVFSNNCFRLKIFFYIYIIFFLLIEINMSFINSLLIIKGRRIKARIEFINILFGNKKWPMLFI